MKNIEKNFFLKTSCGWYGFFLTSGLLKNVWELEDFGQFFSYSAFFCIEISDVVPGIC